MGVYLDYNSSTPIDERVLDKMIDIYRNHFGNADSRTHQFGSSAKNIVENARKQLGSLLNIPSELIYFTSGSTESNNMAILGLESYGHETGKHHIITTAIEHKSILKPCEHLEECGFEVEYVRPHEDGRIHVEDVLNRVRPDTLLVSVMHVNNETGTIQPVYEIGEALAGKEVYFHIDASQSCGKLVEELRVQKYDLLSISAHKMYGPQGVGALVIKNKNGKKSALKAIMYGGGQEREMRPGTLPVALIGGIGEAASFLQDEYQNNRKKYEANRKMILEVLENSGIKYQINGDLTLGIDNTLNISFTDFSSEALMLTLQERALAGISNGSACTSQSYAPSYVLQAMGLDNQRIACAVRLSWGREAIQRELISQITKIVKAWQV